MLNVVYLRLGTFEDDRQHRITVRIRGRRQRAAVVVVVAECVGGARRLHRTGEYLDVKNGIPLRERTTTSLVAGTTANATAEPFGNGVDVGTVHFIVLLLLVYGKTV